MEKLRLKNSYPPSGYIADGTLPGGVGSGGPTWYENFRWGHYSSMDWMAPSGIEGGGFGGGFGGGSAGGWGPNITNRNGFT